MQGLYQAAPLAEDAHLRPLLERLRQLAAADRQLVVRGRLPPPDRIGLPQQPPLLRTAHHRHRARPRLAQVPHACPPVAAHSDRQKKRLGPRLIGCIVMRLQAKEM